MEIIRINFLFEFQRSIWTK